MRLATLRLVCGMATATGKQPGAGWSRGRRTITELKRGGAPARVPPKGRLAQAQALLVLAAAVRRVVGILNDLDLQE